MNKVTLNGKPPKDRINLTPSIISNTVYDYGRAEAGHLEKTSIVVLNSEIFAFRAYLSGWNYFFIKKYNGVGKNGLTEIKELYRDMNHQVDLRSGFNDNFFYKVYGGISMNVFDKESNKLNPQTKVVKEENEFDFCISRCGKFIYVLKNNEVYKYDIAKKLKTIILNWNENISYIKYLFEYNNSVYYVSYENSNFDGIATINKIDILKRTKSKLFEIEETKNGWTLESYSIKNNGDVSFLIAKVKSDGTHIIKKKGWNINTNESIESKESDTNIISTGESILAHLEADEFNFYQCFEKNSYYKEYTAETMYREEK